METINGYYAQLLAKHIEQCEKCKNRQYCEVEVAIQNDWDKAIDIRKKELQNEQQKEIL